MDGQPIGNGAIGVLLVPASEGIAAPANAAKKGPGLEIPYVDSDGKTWAYGGYLWGGRFRNGTVDFRGFFAGSGGMPSQVRLAVFLPEKNQPFVTNVVRPDRHLAMLRAEVSTDGRADLHRVPTPLWGRLDFFKALAITLVVESLLVAVVTSRQMGESPFAKDDRRTRIGAVVAVCVLANLLTLPLVWLIAGHSLIVLGVTKGMLVFFSLEVAVVLVEGTAYGLLSRVGWRTAFRAALIANLSTCLLGFML